MFRREMDQADAVRRSTTVNVLPTSGVLSTETEPLYNVASFFTVDRPSPLPRRSCRS